MLFRSTDAARIADAVRDEAIEEVESGGGAVDFTVLGSSKIITSPLVLSQSVVFCVFLTFQGSQFSIIRHLLFDYQGTQQVCKVGCATALGARMPTPPLVTELI